MHCPSNGGEDAHHRGVDHCVEPKHLQATRSAVRKKAAGLRLELGIATGEGVSWPDAAGDCRHRGRSPSWSWLKSIASLQRRPAGIQQASTGGARGLGHRCAWCLATSLRQWPVGAACLPANGSQSQVFPPLQTGGRLELLSRLRKPVAALMTQRPIHSGPNLRGWLLSTVHAGPAACYAKPSR